ncbi:TetR/AcrR family transcriptional regulator [Leucobacter insecticola]|uniref:TetR/AcrR family transcriptional regulator n=1 Tax=Leucobacter insecticola TaxID=2714934 RepID=A0A6G8FGU2_9MICO|nr:TetR family transcriptional regulator [Leucobacter insecticola]QIM15489.1 TetR/AcrR family transcriptional regulator [Leucobacter insecticola]
MRNSRNDVVSAALRVLEAQGLENCSMRRVAAELDVQPSALYHHVPNKQTLLALMADEIVAEVAPVVAVRGVPDTAAVIPNPGAARELCHRLRNAMLAVRDGADVVATAAAFRLGRSAVEDRLAELVGADGARTLLLYTFAQAQATQMQRQAEAFGALLAQHGTAPGDPAGVGDPEPVDLDESFGRGLDIVLAGLGPVSFT